MSIDSDSNDKVFRAGGSSNDNLEQRFLLTRYKATFETKVRNFNELCWDMCVDKAGPKLDQKTAMCLSNCVDRFLDVTKFITLRLYQ